MKQGSEHIVLVHGFFKNAKDMFPLGENLGKLGYSSHAVNLPTTFGAFADCCAAFKTQLEALELEEFDQVHLVGHSMGGLIIRQFLSENKWAKLGRCVLIGTPNQGTRLADIGGKVPFGQRILKPIEILKSDAALINLPLNQPCPEFGIIAGSNHRLTTGPFLAKPNDGRVEVAATKLDESLMKAFIVLPYVHTKIHDQMITAKLVAQFLANGNFDLAQDEFRGV